MGKILFDVTDLQLRTLRHKNFGGIYEKSVTVELDKARNLRYGMNALVKVEELTGRSITKLDLENISMKDLRTIVYAGLFHEDKDLTPDKVGDLIDEYSNINAVAEKLGEAFNLAVGSSDSKNA